jgi:hypothetical protein
MAAVFSALQSNDATAQLVILPNTSPLAPGDIIINEFRNGWLKLDPITHQIYQLPWPRRTLIGGIEFDHDGALIFRTPQTTGSSFARIHPMTGAASQVGPATVPKLRDFAVEPNGDLLLAIGADSASVAGEVRSVTGNGTLTRYSRSTGTLSEAAGAPFFSPHAVAVNEGRVYIGEFFDGLQEVDLSTGARQLVGGYDNRLVTRINFYSDGDLAVLTRLDGFRRIDPVTGDQLLMLSTLHWRDHAIDHLDNVWALDDSIRRFDATGAETLRIHDTSLSLSAIAIIPEGWTPPPVPEPASVQTALIAIVLTIGGSRRATRVLLNRLV